ncbi:hypothetical protein D3C76_283710 [compost metagenome]
MSSDTKPSDLTPSDLKQLLVDNRENGFLSLNQAQRVFGLEFAKGATYLEAADTAGIHRSQAARTLRDPLVACFINYLNQQKEHYSLIDASFIEVTYLTLLSKLMGEEEVPMLDKEGAPMSRKVFHSSEAVALLRDMAKISGHYKDDPSIIVNVQTKLTEEQQLLLDKVLDERY